MLTKASAAPHWDSGVTGLRPEGQWTPSHGELHLGQAEHLTRTVCPGGHSLVFWELLHRCGRCVVHTAKPG